MQYIPFGADLDLSSTRARIQRYMDHQERHGFSKWIVFDQESGAAIGDAGFFLMPDQKRVELGYRLDRRSWGRGFATEIAQGWLAVAGPWFGFNEVFAFANPENAASLRVIRKLGFSFYRNEQLYGTEMPVWKVKTAEARET